MKTILFFILSAVMFFQLSGCVKSNNDDFACNSTLPTVSVPASEIVAVEAYLENKGIKDAVKSNYGFYYKIDALGTGNKPTICSNVSMLYQGKLVDGTTFDETGSVPYSSILGNLILGWQLGLPLINVGGKIKLYLPPTLGYGSRSNGPIPANSVLIFEITLVAA